MEPDQSTVSNTNPYSQVPPTSQMSTPIVPPVIPRVPAAVIQPSKPLSNSFLQNLFKNKLFFIIGAVIAFLILSWLVYYIYLNLTFKPNGTTRMTKAQYDAAVNYTPIPIPSFVPSTTAPIPTVQEYRNPKGNPDTVNNLSDAVKTSLGVIKVPSNINYIHTEVYKGITIKWTAGQPIPNDRLQWLKDAIDKAPNFYTQNYPPQAIISATQDELGMTKAQQTSNGIYIAAASGTNIFLWPSFFTNGDKYSYYQTVDEKLARKILMHEWMHIAQYYDGVETYTDDYMLHDIGGGLDLVDKASITQRFALAVGWYYQPGWAVMTLKTDPESQKTTDYGRTQLHEDMADTASGVINCDTSQFSQARINIMSQILGQSAQSFCQ